MARRMKMTVRSEDITDGETIYVALDLGRKRWTVGYLLPGDRTARLQHLSGDLRSELGKLLSRLRKQSGGGRIVSCFEAGRDGFWLDRWLARCGVENRVLDPSSLEVPRRLRRAKTDKLDTVGLLRVLLRLERGETDLTRVVRVPDPWVEDMRRLTRERERLVKERTSHIGRIKSLLATQGVMGVRVGARGWVDRLEGARTGDGRVVGPKLVAELRREAARLELLKEQIKEVEAERRAALEEDTSLARDARALMRFNGIAEGFSSGLMFEAFWRDFDNGRQVGGSFGLVPLPFESGEMRKQQPIGKSGNRRARTLAIECAWMWVRHQPRSALTLWWRERFAKGGPRQRKIGIVALARKLMIALWNYLRHGVVPEGAIIR